MYYDKKNNIKNSTRHQVPRETPCIQPHPSYDSSFGGSS